MTAFDLFSAKTFEVDPENETFTAVNGHLANKAGDTIRILATARQQLFRIEQNVESILQKQRLLLTQSSDLGKIYQQILRESILSYRIHCFDMEQTLLQPLEQYDSSDSIPFSIIFAQLLNPLMLPALPHTLGMDLFYRPQAMREEVQGDDVEDEEELEDASNVMDAVQNRNKAHTETIRLLLQYAATHNPSFQLSEFWSYCLVHGDVVLLAEEKRFFLVMLRLFEEGCVDITAWKAQDHPETECQGEFDLSWSLGQIMEQNEEMYGVRKISMYTTEEMTVLEAEYRDTSTGLRCRQSVEMNNILFETEVT